MIVRSRIDAIRGTWQSVDPGPRGHLNGLTVQQLADLVELPSPRLRGLLICTINGHMVYKNKWRSVKPFQRDPDENVVVDFQIPLMGGGRRGGGGAKILSTIAAIAFLGASMLAPGGFFAMGGLFAEGSLSAKLLGAGLAALGSLLLQNVAQPEEPDDESRKQLGVAGASGNEFDPGGPLQYVIGRHKVFPKMLMPPYTTFSPDLRDSFVTGLYGLAGWHDLRDIRINDIGVANAADVTHEIREGLDTDIPLTMLDDTYLEQQVSISLSEWKTDEDITGEASPKLQHNDPIVDSPIFHRVETKQSPDVFRVEYIFSGLLYSDSTDGDEPAGVGFRHRFRSVSDAEWINLPDLVFSDKQGGRAVRAIFNVAWVDEYPPEAGNDWNEEIEHLGISNKRGWRSLLTETEGGADNSSDYATPVSDGFAQWRWEGGQITLYLLKSEHPVGRYIFEVKRSWPIKYVFWAELRALLAAGTRNLFEAFDDGDDWRIPWNPAVIRQSVTLATLQNKWFEYPIDYTQGPPNTFLCIRAMNRSIERVSVIAAGLTPPEYTEMVTTDIIPDPPIQSNPALWFNFVHKGPHTVDITPESLLNRPEITDWYNWCRDTNKRVDAVIDGQTFIEVIQMICLCGFASPIFGAQNGVAVDKARPEGPTGVISRRNASGFGFSKPFPVRPHALRLTFQDRNNNYAVRQITVYDVDYNADGSEGLKLARRFEEIDYKGLTSAGQNIERATLDFNWMRYRSRLLQCKMDIEHLEWRKGDLVWWDTDVIGARGSVARVHEIEVGVPGESELTQQDDVYDVRDYFSLSGGEETILSLKLDDIPAFGLADSDLYDIENVYDIIDYYLLGATKGAAIRLKDGSVMVVEVDSHDEERIYFDPPLIPLSPVQTGAVIVMGPLSQIAKPAIIWDIAPGQDLVADIIAVDYAEAHFYP